MPICLHVLHQSFPESRPVGFPRSRVTSRNH
jgi:hypothetical protein